MIEIIDIKKENIFGLRLNGKFDAQDVKNIFTRLAEKIKGKGKFKLYYEINNLDLSNVSREMIGVEFKFLYKNPTFIANMEKAALITDLEWLKKIAAVEFALIPTLTGKTFSFAEKDEAMKWLKTDQREGKRLDLTFGEFAQSNALKVGGGFALGLLAANFLSKSNRKNVGKAVLVGSVAAGIPLGIKVLNNNRKLVMSNNWTEENVGDQTGKVAVVTGANSGIGFETARVLAENGAKVIMAVRTLEKGETAAKEIGKNFPKADVRVMELDLADLDSVKDFAGNFKKEYSQLDILVNNAGVMIPPYSKTKDGFELQFGTNHLGHFALTAQLLDVLKKTENARVVGVSSLAHTRGKLDFDDLNWEKRDYDEWKSYGDSKLSNLYFTYELNRKCVENDLNIIAVAAHPGITNSNLASHKPIMNFFGRFVGQSPEMGALPTVRAAVETEIEGKDYFGPRGFQELWGYPVKVDSNDLSKNEKIAEQLWKVSEEMTDVKFEFDKKANSVNG